MNQNQIQINNLLNHNHFGKCVLYIAHQTKSALKAFDSYLNKIG